MFHSALRASACFGSQSASQPASQPARLQPSVQARHSQQTSQPALPRDAWCFLEANATQFSKKKKYVPWDLLKLQKKRRFLIFPQEELCERSTHNPQQCQSLRQNFVWRANENVLFIVKTTNRMIPKARGRKTVIFPLRSLWRPISGSGCPRMETCVSLACRTSSSEDRVIQCIPVSLASCGGHLALGLSQPLSTSHRGLNIQFPHEKMRRFYNKNLSATFFQFGVWLSVILCSIILNDLQS